MPSRLALAAWAEFPEQAQRALPHRRGDGSIGSGLAEGESKDGRRLSRHRSPSALSAMVRAWAAALP